MATSIISIQHTKAESKSTGGRSIRLVNPKNFDAMAILPPKLKRYADCASYLVHCIIEGKARGRMTKTGFVPLKVEYLRNVIPLRPERDLRLALIGGGVIECDGQYIKGEKAMGYKLTNEYQGPRAHVAVGGRVAQRILAARKKEFKTETAYPVHKHLAHWLGRLEVDRKQAEDICFKMQNGQDYLTVIDMIEAKYIEFSYCRQGRVHSLATRMPRGLRKALRLDGQALVNIDVKNSQPLLMNVMVMDYRKNGGRFSEFPSFDEGSGKPKNPYLNLSQNNKSFPSTPASSHRPVVTMCISSHEGTEEPETSPLTTDFSALKADEKEYLLLCEAGAFYEEFQKRTGLTDMSRDRFKPYFYQNVLYGKDYPHPMNVAFRQHYPNVHEVVRAAKATAYEDCARMMQLVESSIVVNGVCGRLLREHPEVPVITIHDSIMTTPTNVALVTEIIMEEFRKAGLLPKLSEDAYGAR